MRELFRDGDWRLISWAYRYTNIQHRCAHQYGGVPGWFYVDSKQCGVCNEEVPEPLLGLRLLYTWDR